MIRRMPSIKTSWRREPHPPRPTPPWRRFGLLAIAMGAGGCGAFNPPLATVQNVEIDRYLGRWYEIARIPNSFESGCVGVTADYSLRDDGRINVLNTCVEGSLDGEVRTIEGTARVVDEDTNAKLGVTFFFPFEGPYWILELGDAEDYGYAVVGEPGRSFFWILSREPTLDASIIADVESRMPDWGYDPEKLMMVEQDVDAGTNGMAIPS